MTRTPESLDLGEAELTLAALYKASVGLQVAMEELDRVTVGLPRGSIAQRGAAAEADALCVSLDGVAEIAISYPAKSPGEVIAKASLLRRLCSASGNNASLEERLAISLCDDLGVSA